MEETEYIRQIVAPLTEWFECHARQLPWRSDPRPYYVWVSEIMLQQTRVEAVKPYFARFITELPDIAALARCPEDRLLKLWEGLGYYNRVRNMQKAAAEVMEKYHGALPADYDLLRSLPGIGSYTAGAIASIAFGIPAPAVDGNVLRVISRITENDEDILLQSVKNRIEQELREVIPEKNPGIFNQALMELGALICLPNGAPDCAHCPLRQWCLAELHGRLGEIPKRNKKTKRKQEERTVLVIRDGLHAVLKKRPERGLLAGLYELPNLSGHLSEDEVLTYLKQEHFAPVRIQPLREARHVFSHVQWDMTGYMVLVEEPEDDADQMPGKEYLFVEPERTKEEFPIPSAFAAYVSYLSIRLGPERIPDPDEPVFGNDEIGIY